MKECSRCGALSEANLYCDECGLDLSISFKPPQVQELIAPPPNPSPPNYTNGIGMEFVLIKPGKFQMGSTNSLHPVEISQAFYLGKYQVTQAQWHAVMNSNPAEFKGEGLPVERVSWTDCQEFIGKLNEQENGEGIYRLPTEAEWEYACRAGTTGDYAGDLDEMGWYKDNSGGKTHPVGKKKPNKLGLFDMHGNVWEWCKDWYGNYDITTLELDPEGPSEGSKRVYRGGSWDDEKTLCTSATRGKFGPGYSGHELGVRLLLTIKR